jgi:hypothetical protein
MNYEELEKLVETQGRTEQSRNLLKGVLDKCKRERKTPKEALSEINQVIVNPTSLGTC